MDVWLPANEFVLLRAQADKGFFVRGGLTFEVMGEQSGPWSPDAPPFFEGLGPNSERMRVLMDLPMQRLQLRQAQAIETRMRSRPGWRRRFFGEDAPEWGFYRGHPVAVYWDSEGRRWASLLFRVGDAASEMLLHRTLKICIDEPVQMALF